jgi:hypothetical protein
MTKEKGTPREREAAELAGSLPDGAEQLAEYVMQSIERLHCAVLACDDEAADAAMAAMDAAVWKLNGRTFFGCMADDDAAGRVLARACAAQPGTVPKWGQQGEFLIEVAGMRVRVEVGDGFSIGRHHFAFHVVDVGAPFLSETGYRSHFGRAVGGCTVDEAARRVVAAIVKKEGRRMVQPQSRQLCAERANDCEWLRLAASAAATPTVQTFEDEGGQIAFAF